MRKFSTAFACVVLSYSFTASAQGEYRMGHSLGKLVKLPSGVSANNKQIANNKTTLVIFSRLAKCSKCQEDILSVAAALNTNHPQAQIVIVDTANSLSDVKSELGGRFLSTKAALVVDEDGVWEKAFNTNKGPIFYIVSKEGRVEYKAISSSIKNITSLDSNLGLAVKGMWGKVNDNSAIDLTKGLVPKAIPAAAKGTFKNGQTIIIHHSHGCIPCSEMETDDFHKKISNFAKRNKNFNIFLMTKIYTKTYILDQAKLAEKLYNGAFSNSLREFAKYSLPKSSVLSKYNWPNNVKVVSYEEGDKNDIDSMWGQATTPGLMVFDKGVFLGPTPIYLGQGGADDFISATQDLLSKGR